MTDQIAGLVIATYEHNVINYVTLTQQLQGKGRTMAVIYEQIVCDIIRTTKKTNILRRYDVY